MFSLLSQNQLFKDKFFFDSLSLNFLDEYWAHEHLLIDLIDFVVLCGLNKSVSGFSAVSGPDPVCLVLLVPPPPQLHLHHAVEVFLGPGDAAIGTVVSIVSSGVLLSALLRSTPLLQTDFSLSSLQDLLSFRLSLKHLQAETYEV